MTKAKRILIVEDESHLAQGLLFNLQAEGYEAAIDETGEAALERLHPDRSDAELFDAVLLDVMLPGKSGFDVVAELRERRNFVPVMMLTAQIGRASCRERVCAIV